MGLNHPDDLRAWRTWQEGGRPLRRRAVGLVNRALGRVPAATLTLGGPRPKLVVVLEALKATTRQAQLAPLTHLDPRDVAVLAPSHVRGALPEHDWTTREGAPADLLGQVVDEETVVLSTGHYLPLGATAREFVGDPGRFVTIQHGLLTPDAPPLAHGTTLLAWSRADAIFWRSGRPDVVAHTVGSQLLWDSAGGAAHSPEVDEHATPLYLGQLHGSELPRHALADAAREFCLETGAVYRPHPSETDRGSLALHLALERQGIEIDRSGTPLPSVRRPVVSVYSTGVLEAALWGLPAWVAFPDPPWWLEDFWSRYGLSPWGGPPTPPPTRPEVEPSSAVAHVLAGMMGS